MNAAWQHFLQNWKTTVSGILTVTLATTAGLLAYPPIQQHLKLVSVLGGIQVVAKIWVSLIQQDAK